MAERHGVWSEGEYMQPYKNVDVSEQQLEDLVRRHPEMVEDGLAFVDHQKQAGGRRLDVLLVDSGKSLAVAELKVVQDDGMLMQGIDYYDFVASQIERFARLYKAHSIAPTQQVRLFLIAPSFSQTLINRCRWIDVPISLFTFQCIKLDGKEDLVPIYAEQAIPTPPKVVEVTHLEDHLRYITESQVRDKASALLDDIRNWKPGIISLDPIKNAISMKVNGRVFAYFCSRRQHYIVQTYNDQWVWTAYSIKDDEDLEGVMPLIKTAMERQAAQ